MPPLEKRFAAYGILSLAATWYLVDAALAQTAIDYETDKSAYAWTGFLPFFIPVFWVEGTVKFVLPLAWAVEIVLFTVRRFREIKEEDSK